VQIIVTFLFRGFIKIINSKTEIYDNMNNLLPELPPAIDLETKQILKKTITANRKLAELKGVIAGFGKQLGTPLKNKQTYQQVWYNIGRDKKNRKK
jgi:hypothetical protein